MKTLTAILHYVNSESAPSAFECHLKTVETDSNITKNISQLNPCTKLQMK